VPHKAGVVIQQYTPQKNSVDNVSADDRHQALLESVKHFRNVMHTTSFIRANFKRQRLRSMYKYARDSVTKVRNVAWHVLFYTAVTKQIMGKNLLYDKGF
jgi:hypothetical protein